MRTRQGEDGATSIEYALMTAAIAAVIVTIVFMMGSQVRGKFCAGTLSAEAVSSVAAEGC